MLKDSNEDDVRYTTNDPPHSSNQTIKDGRKSNGLSLEISPKRLAIFLSSIVAAIVFVGVLANLGIYQVFQDPEHRVARLLGRFDLGHEPSLPALFSSFLYFFASVILALLGIWTRRESDRRMIYWFGLSFVFFAMSIDETIMIHEMVSNVIHETFQTSGIFYFGWTIPALIFVSALGLVYFKFLFSLPAITRNLIILGGSVFVVGGVGMEMTAGLFYEELGVESLAHTCTQTIEESCEMMGTVIFIYALTDYIANHFSETVIKVMPKSA